MRPNTVLLAVLLIWAVMAAAQIPYTESFEQEPYQWIAEGSASYDSIHGRTGSSSVFFGDTTSGMLTSFGSVYLSDSASTLFLWILKPSYATGNLYIEYNDGSHWAPYPDWVQINHPGPLWGRYSIPAAPVNGYFKVRLYFSSPNRFTTYNIDDLTYIPRPEAAVQLLSFTASESSSNQAILTWVTQTEVQVVGYNIWRGIDKDYANAHPLGHFVGATNTNFQQTYTFADTGVSESGIYYYWLESRDFLGYNAVFGPVSIALDPDGQDIPPITPDFGITTVFPNPFNPSTNIQYYVSEAGYATLDVFDLRGQQIKRLYAGQREPGTYNQVWDGSDRNGNYLSTGVYCLRLSVGGSVALRKVMIMK